MIKEIEVSPYNTRIDLPDRIIIYDSTLRDGEQMPGVSFTPEQKIAIARKLDEIGVKEIDAGFPAISRNELNTIKRIVKEKIDAKILVLSRLKKQDIDLAISSGADVILLFIASSPIHLKYKLHLSHQQIKDKIVESIEYVKEHGVEASFSTEDSTRTPLKFLKELVTLAYNAGARRIGFTDTVGCATPEAIEYIFSEMSKQVPVPLSAHLHNDFGLALINAIVSLSSGATYICATVNGWGERAGNVSLEQIVMALKILYNKDVGIDTSKLMEISKMVSDFTGIPIPKTQPFVGLNAFRHESGIHVAAILENPRTYECISPDLVGNKRYLVFGKHSGRHSIKKILQDKVEEQLLRKITFKVKELGERNGEVSREEVIQLFNEYRR